MMIEWVRWDWFIIGKKKKKKVKFYKCRPFNRKLSSEAQEEEEPKKKNKKKNSM